MVTALTSDAPVKVRGRLGWNRTASLMAVALVLLLGGVRVTPTGAQTARAEQPAFRVGERWELTDGAYTLVKVYAHGYVLAAVAQPGRQIELTRSLTPVKVERGGKLLWELYPTPLVKWPLEVGRWAVTHASVLKNADHPSGVPVRVTLQVKSFEPVRVAAGSFKAFQIVHAIDVNTSESLRRGGSISGRQSWTVVTWYAPDVDRVVKIEAPGVAPVELEVASVERRPDDVAGAPAPPSAHPPVASPSPRPAPPATGPGRTQEASPPPVERPTAPSPPAVKAPAPTPSPPAVQAPALPPSPPVVQAPAAPALTVEIRHPDDRAQLSEAATTVVAVATSGKGIAGVTVSLNGREVARQQERTPQRGTVVTVPVTAREGTNVLVVTASEPDGSARHEVRTFVYAPAAPKAPPAAPAPPAADRWAVVIGVGKYESKDIPSLRFSVQDAEAVHQALVTHGGFKRENVLLLTDKTERKPTLKNIKWALGTFLARQARKQDIVVVFFAGHGAPEIDPRGVEADGLAKYLVPSDADGGDLYSTALPMDEFQTIFDRLEAERVVVFLDACHSGAAGGRTFASKRTRAGRVDDLFLERLARSRGRAIVTAARSNEVSIELPELGHGLFTYYLLQGLRGAGDLDRDGIVSLQELYQYLDQEVSRKSRSSGGNQHPVMKGEVEGFLPLVRLGPR
jgi:hypothetical protein